MVTFAEAAVFIRGVAWDPMQVDGDDDDAIIRSLAELVGQ